jgi:hypothetical protein
MRKMPILAAEQDVYLQAETSSYDCKIPLNLRGLGASDPAVSRGNLYLLYNTRLNSTLVCSNVSSSKVCDEVVQTQ